MDNEERLDWYRLTPQERFRQSSLLWEHYLALGGSLDPESDTLSPFFDEDEWRAITADGRAGVRSLRVGRIQPGRLSSDQCFVPSNKA